MLGRKVPCGPFAAVPKLRYDACAMRQAPSSCRILLLADTHLGFDAPLRPRVERRRRGDDFFRNTRLALEPALRGEVDLVLTGADRIAANGDVANKIGTYAKALAAREHGVPFHVCAPRSTIDRDTPTGAGIPIEEREADEVLTVRGTSVPTAEVQLTAGWNLVGYPFLDPQDAANLMVRIGSFVVPVADISNTWVDHTAWGYGMGYFAVDLATGRVNPWTAYWFRNSSDQIVELLFPGSGGQPKALLGPAPLAP